MPALLPLALWALIFAAESPSLQITSSAKSFVPRHHGEVHLTVERAMGGKPLRAHATVGTLSSEDLPDASVLHFRWLPPETRFPQTVRFLFWVEGSSPLEAAEFSLPFFGRTDLAVQSEPSAQVKVQVGTRIFGPVDADASGKATVQVEVPPGVLQAKVFAVAQGVKTVRTVPLDAPPDSPIAALLVPSPLVHGGDDGWLLVVHSARAGADPEVAVVGGAADGPRILGPRLWAWKVLPEPGAHALRARVRSGSAQVQTGVEVVDPPRPIRAFLAAGVFGIGEVTVGSMVELGGVIPLPGLGHRLGLESMVGFRALQLPLDASVKAVPLSVALRVKLIEASRWNLNLHGGLSLVNSWFSTPQGGTAMNATGEAFAGTQVGLALAPRWGLYGELRGSVAHFSPPGLPSVNLGGWMLLIGGRYGLL